MSLVPGGEKKTDMEQERENEFLGILKCILEKHIQVSQLMTACSLLTFPVAALHLV